MKYKTTIEIISEADNKDEAIEIAGDYLSGNLVSGVEMKCLTRPAVSFNKNILSVVVFLLLVTAAVSAFHVKPSRSSIPCSSGISAIQPPLNTSADNRNNLEFKKAWQDKETKKALAYITQ